MKAGNQNKAFQRIQKPSELEKKQIVEQMNAGNKTKLKPTLELLCARRISSRGAYPLKQKLKQSHT